MTERREHPGSLLPDVPSDFARRLADRLHAGFDPSITPSPDDETRASDVGSVEDPRRLLPPRYRDAKEIGRGGMGAVLSVHDDVLCRNLAVKVLLHDDVASSASGPHSKALSRFLGEARVMAQLDHPGVVPVHDLGLDENGRVFFTMKRVDGDDLSAVYRMVHEGDRSWSIPRVLGLILRVCEAMSYAHQKGVIHRDLKPANVMVGRFGEVHVMDWGLARVRGEGDRHDLRLRPQGAALQTSESHEQEPLETMSGTVVGTPVYMSPEQARGQVEDVDHRSDVYAVGAMMYELLAGRMPYTLPGTTATPHTVLTELLAGPPAALGQLGVEVTPELVAICEKAMARDADARYRDMATLASDLRAFLEGRTVRAHRSGPIVRLDKWVRRNVALAAAIVAAFVLTLAGAASIAVIESERRSEAEAAARAIAIREGEARDEADRALRTQSLFLADLANQLLEEGEPATALALALEALPQDVESPERPYVPQAEVALFSALRRNREVASLPHDSSVKSAEWNVTGSRLLTRSELGGAYLWEAGGSLVAELPKLPVWDVDDPTAPPAISPDGARIALFDHEHRLHLLDQDGRSIGVLDGHTDSVHALSWSPDGMQLVSASRDETTRLWSLVDQRSMALGERGEPLTDAAFSPDGRRLVTISATGAGWIWDPAGELLATFDGPGGDTFADWSHDGTCLLTLVPGDPCRANVWTADGDELHSLESYWLPVWSPRKLALLLTPSRSGDVQILDADGAITTLRGSGRAVGPPSWTESGCVLVRDENGTVRSFNARGEVENEFSTRDDALSSTSSPDGTHLAFWTMEGAIYSCGPHGSTRLGSHASFVMGLEWSPDGRHFASWSRDATARIWSIENGAFTEPASPTMWDTAMDLSPEGARLASWCDLEGKARAWTMNGQELVPLEDSEVTVESLAWSPDGLRLLGTGSTLAWIWDPVGQVVARLVGHEDTVLEGAWGPTSKFVATASLDGSARIWSASGQPVATLSGHSSWLSGCEWGPDGGALLTSSHDGTARTWSRDGEALAIFEGHGGSVEEAAWSPDGTRIVSSSVDGTARIWDREGRCLSVLEGHEDRVTLARWNPDGTRIVTGSDDDRAIVWSPDGERIATLEHDHWIEDVAWSPDGLRVATACCDWSIRVWTGTGQLVALLSDAVENPGIQRRRVPRQSPVTPTPPGSIAEGPWRPSARTFWSPDGTEIVTATLHATPRIWRVHSTWQGLVRHARSIQSRSLTPEQREAYFLGEE